MNQLFSKSSLRNRKNRSKRSKQELVYNPLESRQLLAATIYVDFGIGAPELTVSNADVVDLGGQQHFGDGYVLSTFEQRIVDSGADLNFDEEFDASDATDFAAVAMEHLREIFDPFDVEIVATNVSSFDNVAELFDASETNDAYIFVRGSKPLSALDFGTTQVDAGNQKDNVGFVFFDDIFDFVLDERNSYVDGPQEYNYAGELSWMVARQIAKQAGHSFGLESIEAVEDGRNVAIGSIMRQPGTAGDGQLLESHSRYSSETSYGVFTQYEFDLRTINGNSNGTQNSFEILKQNLGLKPDAPYYITSNPSGGIVVSPSSSDSLIFTIGDITRTPTAAELEFGVVIVGGVKMGQHPNFNFELRNGAIEVDPAIDRVVSDPSELPDNIFRSRLSHSPVTAINYFGTINDNISYTSSSGKLLIGGEGRDIFRFFEPEVSVGLENPSDLFTSFEFLTPARDKAIGNGGDDIFIMDRIVQSITGNDGQDYFQGIVPVKISGGTGYDVLSTAEPFVIGEAEGGFSTYSPLYPSPVDRMYGIDRIVNPTNEGVVSNGQRGILEPVVPLSFIVDGERTIVHSRDTNARVDLIGFSTIYGFPQDAIFVRDTAYDLSISSGGYIQLSSEFDPMLGHTDQIQHRITFSDLESTSRLVIGAKAGDGLQALFLEDSISGISDDLITLDESATPRITVHGSDTSPDYIAIGGTRSNIDLFGNGGSDIFTLGYAFGGEATLERLRGLTTIDGGSGRDFVSVNETVANPARQLNVSNRYVYKTSNGNRSSFGFARYDGIEDFRLKVEATKTSAGDFVASVFRSSSTRYFYNLTYRSSSDFTSTNELVLVGSNSSENAVFTPASTPSSSPVRIRGGVWTLGSLFQPIFVSRTNITVN